MLQVITPFMSKLFDVDEYLDLPRHFRVVALASLLRRRVRARHQESMSLHSGRRLTKGDFLAALPGIRTLEVEPLPILIAPREKWATPAMQQAMRVSILQSKSRAIAKHPRANVVPATRLHRTAVKTSIWDDAAELARAEGLKRQKCHKK